MRITSRYLLVGALALSVACNSRNSQLAEDPRAAVALTGGLNTSMIYVARTDSGVIAIDLGWWGHEAPMRRALARLGATPADVKRVFITHSHRDHIGAWRMVLPAQFHLADPERARLVGTARHEGWMVRWAERIKPARLPDSGRLRANTFSRDTAFTLGGDTVHAYVVPGHTAGSAVYLFRGVLFMGDAATYRPFSGYRPAKAQFSDDPGQARANLALLWPRVPQGRVRVICTAHGECAPLTAEIVRALGGEWRDETSLDRR
jgi:glyoxylase-like metal-dependent hydrolase (beta-lactamase superfamily II)